MSSELTAIAWRHKTLNLKDPTKHFNIQRMMLNYQRNAPQVKRAAPLTLRLISQCLDHLPKLNLDSYHAKLLSAIILTCYYGCTRIGELCLSNNIENVLKSNCVEFVTLRGETHFQFTLLKYKLSKEPATRAFKENKMAKYCPVKALQSYAQVRPKSASTFFAKQDGRPVIRSFVASAISKLTLFAGLDKNKFSTHSLRAGRASDLAEAGVADSVIRSAGRWRSDAFKCYLRFELLPSPYMS